MHHAAGLGHCDAAAALLDAGANADATADRAGGITPLHAAAAAGHAQAVALLMRYGASTSVRDHNGLTPLEIATQLGHRRAVIREFESQR